MVNNIREIVFDTETTGFYFDKTDRIIEIGAIELVNHIATGNNFHAYINPERDVPEEAYKIHKISTEFLLDKPLFADVVADFLEFIGDSTLIAHNAKFDMNFINAELKRIGKKPLENNVIDTLVLARKMFPSARSNSLNALCSRFEVSLAKRESEGHGALLDSEILAEVYLELIGGKEVSIFAASDIAEKAKKKEVEIAQKPVESIKREFREARDFPVNKDELEAHDDFIKKFGEKAIWLKSS